MRLALAFVALTAAAWAIPVFAPERPAGPYLALHFAMTAAMLHAWARGLDWRWALAAGLAARVILLPLHPFTSNDIERYLWDGAVALQGLDPYRLPPDHPALAALRALWPTPPEHAAFPTLYPPGALALFALCALAGPEFAPWVWKTLVTLAGSATVLLLAGHLRATGQPQRLPLVALSPLLLLEAGVGGHLDALTALSLAGGLVAFQRGRPGLAGLALGAGAALKLLPLAALGPLLIAAAWPGRLRLLAGAGAVLAAAYGGALALGLAPIGALPVFFETWRNAAPLFILLERALPAPWLQLTLGAVALGLLAASALLARRRTSAAVGLALAAPLAASPVAFPWYLCVFAPVVARAPSAALLAWMSLAPLTYEVLDGFKSAGVWAPADWPLWAILAGVLAGAAFDLRAAARSRAGQTPPMPRDPAGTRAAPAPPGPPAP